MHAHTHQLPHVNASCPWRVCLRPHFTHTHTHYHSAPPESPPPSALHSPACQSSGPSETSTWDWPTLTKEELIDRRRQRGVCAPCLSAGWAGRWWMMLISQSVSPWITPPPTWESTTSPSVYLYIGFKLLSASESLSSFLEVEETYPPAG